MSSFGRSPKTLTRVAWCDGLKGDDGRLLFSSTSPGSVIIHLAQRSQSRMRGDYLFYEEKIETTHEEKQAKAARRFVWFCPLAYLFTSACISASKASDLTGNHPAPPRRKDRPSKVNGLTKQTYSVTVRMPGASNTRKWHIVAYFSVRSRKPDREVSLMYHSLGMRLHAPSSCRQL